MDAAPDKPGATIPSPKPSSPPSKRRLVVDWLFVLVGLFGGTLVLDRYVPPRSHPVNISDPRVQWPMVEEIVPTYALGLMALLLPAATFCVFEFGILRQQRRFFAALNTFALGLAEACGFTLVYTNCLKLVVARPRPFFAAVCGSLNKNESWTKCSNGVSKVKDAVKSFPSGHSSLAFACFTYLALYMALRMRMTTAWSGYKSLKFLALSIPVGIACFVAVSRVIDYHHNYDDILAGSVLGAAVAVAVWHSRWQEIENSARPESQDEGSMLPLPAQMAPPVESYASTLPYAS